MNLIRLIPKKKNIIYSLKYNFSSKSFLSEIQEREDKLYDRVMNTDQVTSTELINFTRIINKRNSKDDAAFQKFFKLLPNHIQNFDEIDIRKVCSLLDGRDINQDLIKQLRDRSKHLREEKGVDEEFHQMFKPKREEIWKNSPLAIKFYTLLGVYRDKIMNSMNIIKLK